MNWIFWRIAKFKMSEPTHSWTWLIHNTCSEIRFWKSSPYLPEANEWFSVFNHKTKQKRFWFPCRLAYFWLTNMNIIKEISIRSVTTINHQSLHTFTAILWTLSVWTEPEILMSSWQQSLSYSAMSSTHALPLFAFKMTSMIFNLCIPYSCNVNFAPCYDFIYIMLMYLPKSIFLIWIWIWTLEWKHLLRLV